MGEQLKGKVAIITGAGSIAPGMGIGKATAILFVRDGARVMVVDINQEAAEETKRLIDEDGGEARRSRLPGLCLSRKLGQGLSK